MGLAVPLRARAPGRGRWPGGGRLVAAPHAAALVAAHRGPGRRGRVGGGPVRRAVAIPDADRARLRGHHHLRGRRVDFGRDCGRPVPAAASAGTGNRRAHLVGAVVGASAPPRESPARTQAASLARYRQSHRASRGGGHVRHRRCVGMARAVPAGTRPDHSDVVAKIPAIESGLGTFRGAVRVYPTPDDLAHRCEIRVLDVDPHAGAIPWPGPSVTSITQPVDLGPFEDAAPCRVPLPACMAFSAAPPGRARAAG